MKYTIPPTYLFHYAHNMEEDLCKGVVYFTVMCDHLSLVSLLFAVLVSLHPVTFCFLLHRVNTVTVNVYCTAT